MQAYFQSKPVVFFDDPNEMLFVHLHYLSKTEHD